MQTIIKGQEYTVSVSDNETEDTNALCIASLDSRVILICTEFVPDLPTGTIESILNLSAEDILDGKVFDISPDCDEQMIVLDANGSGDWLSIFDELVTLRPVNNTQFS